mmetsp:Transcript_24914/g.50608  ORF Transcript_24914/g.50608 Transcript_24914/m.50608 type:complete len:856 (-) Transcript_24914:80-2647(-)|eukprot:CAMPEP_0181331046 /NCGR_PEP_ID=MMETSP1101-20121128/24269_1 /TAXON_ID=46948 /ORGANISM="Rhodomonas abbreviata, Strain Caron Lab Isolate" /LENGTH=855 /DNA_ID=CAMNT_0023440433 /DNA_START=103 /DNA_END=2670 /DNA_ORIENTATION=+
MGCIQAKSVVVDEPQSLEQEFELEAEGFDDDTDVPGVDPAYVPNIGRMDSEDITSRWSKPRIRLKEYCKAAETMCLSPQWVAHTRLLRYVRGTRILLQNDQRMKEQYLSNQYFEQLLVQLIKKAFQLSADSDAKHQKDGITGANIFEAGSSLWNSMKWRKPYMTHAIHILVEHEDRDTIVVKLSEVCDRATRCSSAQRQAFNVLVGHSYHIIQRKQSASVPGQQPAGASYPKSDTIPEADSRQTLRVFLNGGEPRSRDVECAEGALQRVYECVEDFLDDFKEKAFFSAFIEPCRFYFDIVGDESGRDHVNVHGLNWYLALLNSTLGAQVPLLPELSDPHLMGVSDFWAALSDESWRAFAAPENFGKDFQGIGDLKKAAARKLKKRVCAGQLPEGFNLRMNLPKLLGNAAVDPGARKGSKQRLAIYIERFAHFFRAEYLVARMFETLNAENKPEHVGFRKACAVLFAEYREETGAEDESLIEHVYADELYTELDVGRVLDFFAWLHVVKPRKQPAGASAESSAASREDTTQPKQRDGDAQERINLETMKQQMSLQMQQETQQRDEPQHSLSPQPASPRASAGAVAAGSDAGRTGRWMECPICMEEKEDVEVLEHWEAKGDISSHRMCAECRGRYHGQGCPFCREVMHKDELLAFIREFLESVSAAGDDANTNAAVLERWQLLEMEYEAQPAAVHRVATLVVKDLEFFARVQQAVRTKAGWLRDAAGIIFRFSGLYELGKLQTSAEVGGVLREAVEAILAPWEGRSANKLHGHYYGALYMQAVLAWLLAWNAGEDTSVLKRVVQRVGKAVVSNFQKRGSTRQLKAEFKERVHTEYLQLSHTPVWGGQQQDLVWKTFF